MWRIVFALVLLIFGSVAAFAQSSAPQKQTSETTVDPKTLPDEFSERDCQRLDSLLEAMSARSPEIQFLVSKMVPGVSMNVKTLARGLVLGTPPKGQPADEESRSKEFWNRLMRSRRPMCSIGTGTLLVKGDPAYSFVSEIQKRFPKQQRLNPEDVARLKRMCCYQAERLANAYEDFRRCQTIPKGLTEKEISDWKSYTSSVRLQLADRSGASAVAMIEADLREEQHQHRTENSVLLTTEQEREFIDMSSKALIKNSPEINFILTKLTPDHSWLALVSALLMRRDISVGRSPLQRVNNLRDAVLEVQGETTAREESESTHSVRLLLEKIFDANGDRPTCGVSPASTLKPRPFSLNGTERITMYNMLRDLCNSARYSYRDYLLTYKSDDTDASANRAVARVVLVERFGEDVVQNLDKMLSEAKSKS